MQLSDFDYTLPPELIAQTPTTPRDHSKLLILDKQDGHIEDKHFYNLLDELGENDVLVLNKTRVINARLVGYIQRPVSTKNETGLQDKKCEVFLHKQISDNTWDCLVYPGKKLKPGTKVYFYKNNFNFGINEEGLSESQSSIGGVSVGINSKHGNYLLTATIKSISDSGRIVEFSKGGVEFLDIVDTLGQVPLPPYIKEKLDDMDRYQTVFNEVSGSVAAPTAGLHFTPELIEKLEKKGVKFEKVLLHVGLGTFNGVDTENILEHKMHSEYIELEKDVANRLNKYKSENKRIIAVGTTSIRVLESFSNNDGVLISGNKETSIFIYPGYSWKFVDAIITNFHLPKSTLLMLVSSFVGEENIKKAYEHAISNKYRFFSFGDAMFLK